MKGKTILGLAAASVLALTMLVGCGKEKAGAKSDLKDGKYKVEFDQPDQRGWTAFTEVTVKDGKITEVNYDYINAEGKLKTEDEAYNTRMKESDAKTNPKEAFPKLEEALVKSQDPAKVDSVTGATSSSKHFVDQVKKLIEEKIKKGDTATLKLTQPDPKKEEAKSDLKDGTYKAEYDNFDSHTWKAFVEITVKDGKISAAKFDYINAEGKLKSEDEDYNTKMKGASGTNPKEAFPKLAEALVKAQDPTKVDSVTGATNSSKGFVELATKLVENIKAGKTDTLVIPQPSK